MPEAKNPQVSMIDLADLSLDRLDDISQSALWHAVHEILDTSNDGAPVATFTSYTPPPLEHGF
jgi:FXSXX-COOH protein